MKFIQDAYGNVSIYTKEWRYVGHFFGKNMNFTYVTPYNCKPYILITSNTYTCRFVYEPTIDEWEVE